MAIFGIGREVVGETDPRFPRRSLLRFTFSADLMWRAMVQYRPSFLCEKKAHEKKDSSLKLRQPPFSLPNFVSCSSKVHLERTDRNKICTFLLEQSFRLARTVGGL